MPEKRYGRLTRPWDCVVLPTNSQWLIFVAMLLDGCVPTDLSFLYPYTLCQTTLKCDVCYPPDGTTTIDKHQAHDNVASQGEVCGMSDVGERLILIVTAIFLPISDGKVGKAFKAFGAVRFRCIHHRSPKCLCPYKPLLCE